MDGALDEARVRQAVALLIEKKPRVLRYFAGAAAVGEVGCKQSLGPRGKCSGLSEAQQQEVRASLGRLKGADVEVEFAENADLIGGMRVKLGDDVYDGSVKTRLSRLAESF